MDTTPHDLSSLFSQLGLANKPVDVDAFASTHRLEAGQRLGDAPFWTSAQAQFLAESLEEDSVWAPAADELSLKLSHKVRGR